MCGCVYLWVGEWMSVYEYWRGFVKHWTTFVNTIWFDGFSKTHVKMTIQEAHSLGSTNANKIEDDCFCVCARYFVRFYYYIYFLISCLPLMQYIKYQNIIIIGMNWLESSSSYGESFILTQTYANRYSVTHGIGSKSTLIHIIHIIMPFVFKFLVQSRGKWRMVDQEKQITANGWMRWKIATDCVQLPDINSFVAFNTIMGICGNLLLYLF